MTGRVIQGFFIGGRARVPAPVAQLKAMPRPPGPPVAAFAARPPVAQARGSADSFQIDPRQVGLVSGGGRPLPDAVRGKMETALGADFSAVRVHVGPQAERIGAAAFTMGTDIYFAPGRFQPDTMQGQELLGHELAHVVQQRQGRVRNPMGSGVAVVQDRALEAEADRLGRQAAVSSVAPALSIQPSSLQTLRVVSLPGRVRIEALAKNRLAPIGGVELRHGAPGGSAELCNLRVAESYRGRHLGAVLVRKAVETAQSVGVRSVVLEVRPTDRDIGPNVLKSMYQKLGFHAAGRSAAGNALMVQVTGGQGANLAIRQRSAKPNPSTVQRMERPDSYKLDDYGVMTSQNAPRRQRGSRLTRTNSATSFAEYFNPNERRLIEQQAAEAVDQHRKKNQSIPPPKTVQGRTLEIAVLDHFRRRGQIAIDLNDVKGNMAGLDIVVLFGDAYRLVQCKNFIGDGSFDSNHCLLEKFLKEFRRGNSAGVLTDGCARALNRLKGCNPNHVFQRFVTSIEKLSIWEQDEERPDDWNPWIRANAALLDIVTTSGCIDPPDTIDPRKTLDPATLYAFLDPESIFPTAQFSFVATAMPHKEPGRRKLGMLAAKDVTTRLRGKKGNFVRYTKRRREEEEDANDDWQPPTSNHSDSDDDDSPPPPRPTKRLRSGDK
jgi:GNAT superfamily N-acetyltransferase